MDIGHGDIRLIDVSVIPRLVSFGFFSPQEVSNLGTVEIFCPVFFDSKGAPINGGLCDERMGTQTKQNLCGSCKNSYSYCPGHYGYIEFPVPLINPLLKNLLFAILKTKCWYCGSFKISSWKLRYFYLKLTLLDIDFPLVTIKKKKRGGKFLSFQKRSGLKFYNKINQYLRLIESKNTEIEKKNIKTGGFMLYQIQKKRRGPLWSKIVSTFFEKCWKEKSCRKCNRQVVEQKKLEELQSSSRKKKKTKINLDLNFPVIYPKAVYKKFSFLSQDTNIFFSKVEEKKVGAFQIKDTIDSLWKLENVLCDLIWGSSKKIHFDTVKNSPFMFFLNSILVPPTRFRPIYLSNLVDSKKETFSNPQNFYFSRILKLNQQILLAIGTEKSNFSEKWGVKSLFELEKEVSNFYDNTASSKKWDRENPLGIRQQLEKKMGLFRMHLMGKRVFHSARSIIVPDPFLEGNEVGIPLKFANKLMIPENLNIFNIKTMVSSKKFPPNELEYSSRNFPFFMTILGSKLRFNKLGMDLKNARLIEICSKYFNRYRSDHGYVFGLNKFYRFPKKGDIVLLNRQPSLHRVSIMAHKVRIIPGSKCIRLHYANCSSYNADFDGDEMNLHFPQSYLARAECLVLTLASNQGKVPTNENPIRGLIQDHIISSVFLTKKDTFFDQKGFSQLLSCFIDQESSYLLFCCPTIIKPKILWTGKQVISTFWKIISNDIKNFFLESRTKLTRLSFGNDETKVLIRKGQLLRGVLDGSQLGKNRYGVLNAFLDIFGESLTNQFLKGFSHILTFFQRIHGHTTGLDDLILREKTDKQRTKIFRKEREISKLYLRKILSNQGVYYHYNHKEFIDFSSYVKIMGFLSSKKNFFSQFIISLKNILSGTFSKNVEPCVPGGLEKAFLFNGFSKMTISGAKGSLVNTFQICLSLGQTELEGRCVPRGIGGKTLPCFPPFDPSSRANGYISQRFLTGISQADFFFHCMAGREGLLDTAVKTSQSGYIQRSLIKHLENLSIQYDFSVRFGKSQISQMIYSNNGIVLNEMDLSNQTKWLIQNFTKGFPPINFPQIFLKKKLGKKGDQLSRSCNFSYFIYNLFGFGSILKIARDFFKLKKNFLLKNLYFAMEKNFFGLYLKNLNEPGEPVGVITGQSLGEPCTQMTLNTFHFAGKLASSGNIGIPRLKEILLTASKQPKAPTMSVALKKNLPRRKLIFVEKRLKTILLQDLIHAISSHTEKNKQTITISIRLKLSPRSVYKHQFALKTENIILETDNFWKGLKNSLNPPKADKTKKKDKNQTTIFKNKISIKKKLKKGCSPFRNFFSPALNLLSFKTISQRKIQEKKTSISKILVDGIFGSKFCIRNVPRISNCFLDYTEKTLHTEGVNFFALWQYEDIIDVNKIFSNDIYGVMVTYGIEATRNFLHYELSTIFKFQAILVKNQHLDLISDYMTRLGNYRAFNRQGLLEENSFQKITYETAIRFITDNAVNKNFDDLSSVSSSISFAKTCELGTGTVDLYY